MAPWEVMTAPDPAQQVRLDRPTESIASEHCPAARIGRAIGEASYKLDLAQTAALNGPLEHRPVAAARAGFLERKLGKLRRRLAEVRAASLTGALAQAMEADILLGRPGQEPFKASDREADNAAGHRLLASVIAAIEAAGPRREEVGGLCLRPRWAD